MLGDPIHFKVDPGGQTSQQHTSSESHR
jgi:hypothetical protein